MTSPTDGGITSQNGGVGICQTTNWDPSSAAAASSAAALNGSSSSLQQPFNLWPNPSYFTGASANSGFGSTSSYPTDLSYPWNASHWNAAAAADPRFPMSKLNVPSASSFNTNLPFMASALSSMAAGNAMRNSRRRRNLFSQNQVNELKRAFDKEPYVKPETREKLAAATGLTPQQVKIWFQNNRYKCKQKQKEDDRVQNRPHHSGSFNDSGSIESPSSSGNELSMTATNSPEIKLQNDISSSMTIQPHDVSSDIKPSIYDVKQDLTVPYPPMGYPYHHHYPTFPMGMNMYPAMPSGTDGSYLQYFNK